MDQKTSAPISRHSNRTYILLAAVALILGGSIYVFTRSSEFVFFRWIESIGLGNWLNLAREHAFSDNSILPVWIVYSLPSGLWAFAYAVIITGIWSKSRSRIRYVWLATIPLLVFGFEILQYAGILSGTFSIQDLVLGMIGIILGVLLGNYTHKRLYHEKTTE
jgi:hypothetical protein